MCIQVIVQTHVTGVFVSVFCRKNSTEARRLLCVACHPFGYSEDQQGQPDKTEREQLGRAKRFIEKENSQK